MIYRTGKKINESNCEKMANELSQILNSGEDVIIDLKDTEYISSSGIRYILLAFKSFRAKGYDFSVINPSDYIKEIFDNIGISDILLIQNDETNGKTI